jgi:hypothetical protein
MPQSIAAWPPGSSAPHTLDVRAQMAGSAFADLLKRSEEGEEQAGSVITLPRFPRLVRKGAEVQALPSGARRIRTADLLGAICADMQGVGHSWREVPEICAGRLEMTDGYRCRIKI